MKVLARCLSKPHPQSCPRHHNRTFGEEAAAPTFRCGRDRGLDHSVEREKNLRPLLNIKNLIKSEPSKSLPVSIITQHKESLKIPTRPIEFIRKYPSIFEEFLPGGIGFHPHIKLRPEVLNLDAEEQLVYQSESYRQHLADRLLKLLMILRISKIPLSVLDILKWDLGLPQDYLKTLVPEFPDYFRVVGRKESSSGSEEIRELELVCWNDQLAVSILEKKVMNGKTGYSKRMPIAFPMKFPRDFVMDKKMKKSVDEWQKLPYVSPYEYAVHLSPKSDESDKWAAAVLHEVLNLFVAKKAERENVLCLGDYLGTRSRFKRVLLQHRGIFYLSSKIGTYTVVLKDAYKRGLLIETNPLMNIRHRYIHLMNTVKKDHKAITVPGGSKQEGKEATKEKECDDDSREENDLESNELSGSEVEDASDDDYEDDDDDDEEDENEGQRGARKNVAVSRGKTNRRKNLDLKGRPGNAEREREIGKHHGKNKGKILPKFSSRTERGGGYNVHGSSQERSTSPQSRDAEGEREMGKHRGKTKEKILPKFSSRTERRGGQNVRGSSQERSNLPQSLGRSLPDKRTI